MSVAQLAREEGITQQTLYNWRNQLKEQGQVAAPISQDEFKVLLSEVDIGLFSLARSHTAHNFPGKILGYIANDLPILVSVNPGNDLMSVINDHQAGFVFENGDDEALLRAARDLVVSFDLRKHYGKNACALLESHFSVQSAGAQIVSAIEKRVV